MVELRLGLAVSSLKASRNVLPVPAPPIGRLTSGPASSVRKKLTIIPVAISVRLTGGGGITRSSVAAAIAHFQKAIEIKPDYPEAHNNRGLALTGLERHAEALADQGFDEVAGAHGHGGFIDNDAPTG